LPIYHVHGFLPRHPRDYNGIEKADLAFSEEGYHRMFADPFHWSNLVQLNHLREGPCLMLGLSMTDPNLRRLLEVSARGLEDSRHYVFMERLTLDAFLKAKDGKRVELRRKPAEAFLRSHHSLHETLFRELRIKVVWFESFAELPDYVRTLRGPSQPSVS
jgi:SIR2-like domain